MRTQSFNDARSPSAAGVSLGLCVEGEVATKGQREDYSQHQPRGFLCAMLRDSGGKEEPFHLYNYV